MLAGLRVTVLQPYSKAAKSLQGWLDLSVAFGQLPPLPLTGVLASTFPTAETKRDSWIK